MDEFFIYGTFFGLLLLFVPVFVYVDFYADARGNKLWFSVSLYRFLRVFGGYGELRKDGIAVHLTKKFALFLPYDDIIKKRRKFKITKGFQLWRLHQIIEIGGVGKIYAVLVAAAIEGAFGSVYGFVRTRYPFVSLKNSAIFSEEPCLKVTNQTAVAFNGLVLAVTLAKITLEALINWIRRKKSTASWKKQPSN